LTLENQVEISPVPNGDDKNWVRLCAAIDGFRIKYGKWPTKILLGAGEFEDLKDWIFSAEGFAKMEEKLTFVVQEGCFDAVDDEGLSYSYMRSGFLDSEPDITAREWLGVFPDLLDEDEVILIRK
jgi:hypothetical protein